MLLKPLKKQHGIATVLIVLLVGVALSASTLGVIYTVKTTQNKQVTSHAKTNAQSAAWALAEAARSYLDALSPEELTLLMQKIDIGPVEISPTLVADLGYLRNSTITFSSYLVIDSKHQFAITIKAVDTRSVSASSLNLVFEVTPGTVARECPDPAKSQLAGDVEGEKLDLGVHGSPENSEFTVDGSWINPTDASALAGVDRFLVTGEVVLKGTDGGNPVNKIKANEGVTIQGSVSIGTIETGGTVLVTNNANIGEILAMEDVNWQSSGATSKIQAHQTATIINGLHEHITTGVEAQIVSPAGSTPDGGPINIDSLGTVDFAATNYTSFGTVQAIGNVTCSTRNAIEKITSEGTIGDTCNTPNRNASTAVSISPIRVYEPVVVEKSTIADADGYDAHYSFKYDKDAPEADRYRVTVQNIKGLDGDYILYDGATKADLLRRPGAEPQATDPSICVTANITRGCIDFDKDVSVDTEGLTAAEDRPTGRWIVTGEPSKLAPGIMYFDRDLEINQIDYRINGFLSAGNIGVETSNQNMIIALNAAPSEVLCGGNEIKIEGEGESLALSHTANTTWFDNGTGVYPYPTDFCFGSPPVKRTTVGEGEDAVPATQPFIGQFALMAGQQNPVPDDEEDLDATYQGGDIYLRSILNVFGRIIAGNSLKLITETNLQVWGTVGSEARREGTSDAKNIMNGSIDIYPDAVEQLGEAGSNNCTPSTRTSSNTSLLWSRYL